MLLTFSTSCMLCLYSYAQFPKTVASAGVVKGVCGLWSAAEPSQNKKGNAETPRMEAAKPSLEEGRRGKNNV